VEGGEGVERLIRKAGGIGLREVDAEGGEG